ncbi:MAG: hypothetical protein HKN87_08420 [Saprospiraceae bacterium]|nr:hypothetical protein [Saprospiraceae bacterium]
MAQTIRYASTQTIPFDWQDLRHDTIYFQDSLTGIALYQVRNFMDIPIYYARDILTEVCFDSICRPLRGTIYWNITGRYLGFALPDGEYLSRYDHEAFEEPDYTQLNSLLADPYLPFYGITFQALIQPTEIEDHTSVDGISGATSTAISSYVVHGAAYTTYTMWNIVYGPMRSYIEEITTDQLTSKLLTKILQSDSDADKIWGLKKIEPNAILDIQIERVLLDLVENGDFSVAHTTLKMISPRHLSSETLQVGLLHTYNTVEYNLRKPILQKFMEAAALSPLVIEGTSKLLSSMNGVQLGYLLALYEKHKIYSLEILATVAELLQQGNRFKAEKAHKYLSSARIDSGQIKEVLKAYETSK